MIRTKEVFGYGFTVEWFRTKGWMYKAGGNALRKNGKPQWRTLWFPLGSVSVYKVYTGKP